VSSSLGLQLIRLGLLHMGQLFTGLASGGGFANLRGVVSTISSDPTGAVSNLTESCLLANDATLPGGARRL